MPPAEVVTAAEGVVKKGLVKLAHFESLSRPAVHASHGEAGKTGHTGV